MNVFLKKINEVNQIKYILISLFFFILIICPLSYYWAKFGFDTTDTGFFLYSQSKINFENISESGPNLYWIGSDLVGALWLKIIGAPSLQNARLGAYLLNGIIFLIIHFSLLNIINDKIKAIVVSLITYFLFGANNIFPIINYDLAPLLPISLLFLIFTRIIYKHENYKIYYYLIGVLIYLMIFMRFPLIILAFLFLLLFIFQSKNDKKVIALVILIGFVSIQIILIQFDFIKNPTSLFYVTIVDSLNKILGISHVSTSSFSLLSSNNYGLLDQISYWLRGYFRIIIFTFLFIVFVSTLYLKMSKRALDFFIAFAMFLLSILIVFPFYIFKINLETIQSQLLNIYLLSGLCIFFFFNFLFIKNINKWALFFIVALFILYPLGSNSFEKKLIITFPLVVPAIYFLFDMSIVNFSNPRSELFYKSTVMLSKIVFIPICFSVLYNYKNFPYKDSSIDKLTFHFRVASLFNVNTTQRRKDEIEKVLIFLNNHKRSDSKMLCLGKISMFNYLTNMDGVFDYPWPTYLGFNYFSSNISHSINLNNKLDFIVLPLYDVTQDGWEFRHDPIDIKPEYIAYVKDFAIKQGYSEAFKTEYFLILKTNRF